MARQHTISKPFSFSGRGLHTGLMVNASVFPGEDNSGILFQRVDLEDEPIVKAKVEFVSDTSRSTVLERDGVRISTVEHILSALTGMGIDNAIVKLDGPEIPILDGNASKFTEAIKLAGVIEQKSERDYFEIKDPIIFRDEERGVEIIALPSDEFNLSVMIDYNSVVIGNQFAALNNIDEFEKEIAPCRTFVFFRELEFLWKNNLIKGGSLDNAIVVLDREVSQDELDRIADLFNKPRIQVRSQGILSNTNLQFPNEPARHKLLDLIGDLALIGTRIKGKIIATRPGHLANVTFAKQVKDYIKKERKVNCAPRVDFTKPPLLDVNEIMSLLPHRPPFLLIDRILKMSDKMIVGQKNVTMNEQFFVGHFPQEPVMPGVLIVEAMAQCGGILVLRGVENPQDYSTYFLKIDNVRFKRKIVPGDTIIFRLELEEAIRHGVAKMKGKAFVGGQVAAEGELMAQIVLNK